MRLLSIHAFCTAQTPEPKAGPDVLFPDVETKDGGRPAPEQAGKQSDASTQFCRISKVWKKI